MDDKADRHRNDRQDRLKAALRENLKRRKSQARARAEAPPRDDTPDPPKSGVRRRG